MNRNPNRQLSEIKTIRTMIEIYCRGRHGSRRGQLCASCAALAEYAAERIKKCPHGDRKTTCRLCATHCYAPRQREHVREVMRYAGPRMLLHDPAAALIHLLREKLARNK